MQFSFPKAGFFLCVWLFTQSTNLCWAQSASEKKDTIHGCLLQIYRSQHKKEADGEYQALIALKPNDDQIRYDYASYLLSSGELGKAIVQYRKIVALQPRRGDYWAALGAALLPNKETDAAVQADRKAVEIGGQKYMEQLNRALQYQQQQQQYANYKKQIKDQD